VSQAKTVVEFTQMDHHDLCMAISTSAQLKRIAELMNKSEASTKTKENEIFALDVQRLTRLHIKYALFFMARERLSASNFKDKNILGILELLTKIFALKELQQDNTLLYETGFFGKGSLQLLNDSTDELLLQLRPHIIPIVEMAGLMKEDTWLVSTIGNKYGDIYET